MNTINDPRDFRELLGAYALGAVSGEEAEQLEAHVKVDRDAQAELGDYRRTVACLRSEDGPSDSVWRRIEQAMHDAEPVVPARVASLAEHRWRHRTVRVGVAAAVAAAVIALAVWGGSRLTSQSPPIQPASELRHAAEQVADQPGSRHLELISNDRRIHLDVLVSASGRAFLLGGKLAPAHPLRGLALYVTTKTETLLVEDVNPTLRIVEFQLPGDALSLVLGETTGAGPGVLNVAQVPLAGTCVPSCAGTPSSTNPNPNQSGPAAAPPTAAPSTPGVGGSRQVGSGPGGVLLPPLTVPTLPTLPPLPLLPKLPLVRL